MQRIKKTYCSKTIHRIEKVFHTERYKLNLIEPSDPFLPEALNANTQKVEDVLVEHMEGPVADLDARVTVLEGHRFACAAYTGESPENDGWRTFQLGFRPKAVYIDMLGNHAGRPNLIVDGEGQESAILKFLDDGFSTTMNLRLHSYAFLAFA